MEDGWSKMKKVMRERSDEGMKEGRHRNGEMNGDNALSVGIVCGVGINESAFTTDIGSTVLLITFFVLQGSHSFICRPSV
jgi:hypothetical protein